MSTLGILANKEINNFLRTVTIKNSYFATRSRNRQMRVNRTSVPENIIPYYRHIAGEYILKATVTCDVKNPKTGLYETQTYGDTALVLNGYGYQNREVKNTDLYEESVFDEMMYVTSLDTGEEIPFTLENLHPEFASDETAVHEKTLAAYKVTGRLYDLLCAKYPAQVDLIKAIVYPVTSVRGITDVELNEFAKNGESLPDYKRRRRDAIVAADDYSLLACDETILEELERHDLITFIRMMLRNLNKRWNIEEFWKEQNYPMVLWSITWCALYLGLIIRRYENIRTQFAHSSHVWDFLESKGLGSYRGYLTKAQTKFLYKNIEYILRNSGKQKVTNILVDEFLNDIGLNLKTKTVVLDTSSTLDASKLHHISEVAKQCESCSRRSFCHKNISTFACPNYLNVSGLCEAEPIILTEEFVGSSKTKITDALVKQYGYSETDARVKYERSLIWKDDEIESIRSDYDRNQLTDTSGQIESLDTLIQREHSSGLEPVYNDDVVAQQTKELQHISGTVAPTKLIELTKNRPSPKYASLFNKFLTETLIHLAPRVYSYEKADGSIATELLNKVSIDYDLAFRNVSMNAQLSYGELIALMYMGVVKENKIDLFFDHCRHDERYSAEAQYYRLGTYYQSGEENKELDTLVNASRLLPLTKGDYVIGKDIVTEVYVKRDDEYVRTTDTTYRETETYYKKVSVGVYEEIKPGDYVAQDLIEDDRVYQWAPWKNSNNKLIDLAAGHDPLTDFNTKWTYDFPVPYQARIKTTFKFGKPVKQDDLVEAWAKAEADGSDYDVDFLYLSLVPDEILKLRESTGSSIHVLIINDVLYVVSEIKQDAPDIWDGWSTPLRIDGVIKNDIFIPARDEIAIIPKYAKWYSTHLTPDSDKDVTGTKNFTVIDDDLPMDVDDVEGNEDQDTETIVVKFDANKGRRYIQLDIEKYFDLDSFLNGYVEQLNTITTQEELGSYLAKMFTLLEKTYAYAEGSPRAEVQVCVRAILDVCLVNVKNYRFDLTGTNKTSRWINEDVSRYPIEKDPIPVAFYSDWLKRKDNLLEICETIDSNDQAAEIWKEFNSDCIIKVLENCNSPYVITASDVELTSKIKELVTSLSSYKIAFLDGDDTDRFTDSPVAVTDGSASHSIDVTNIEYVSPTMDSACNPHISCYETDETGCILMRTPDTHAGEGVMYYEVVNEANVDESLDDSMIDVNETEDGHKYIDVEDTLDLDTIFYRGNTFEEGTLLPPNTYYERIDIRKVLGVSTAGDSVVVFKRSSSGKWMCRVGAPMINRKIVPTYTTDRQAEKSEDAFISSLKVDPSQRKKLVTYKYRKTIDVNDYGWTAWMEIPYTLTDYMSVFSMSRTVFVHDKTDVGIIVETGDSTVDDKWKLDFGYTDENNVEWQDIHRSFIER